MLLGYKPRFRKPIEEGTKIHTFRGVRKDKRLPKLGERFYMYTGVRTKNCQLITKEHCSKSYQKVRMVIKREFPYSPLNQPIVTSYQIHIGNKREWSFLELNEMVINDGFKTIHEFLEYWLDGKEKVVFSGYCHHWTDFKYE